MWIIILIALFLPRLAAVLLWMFTHWFRGVFDTWIWPLLGFIFMPYTMLWYSAVIQWWDGRWGIWQIAVLALAIIADISSGSKSKDMRSA